MEEWRDVKNYEGYYQISNLGRVKSLNRVVNHKGLGKIKIKERILKTNTDDRYETVGLHKKGVVKTVRIHTLVTQAFLNHTASDDRKMVVDHIDNNKLNNKLSNLRIISNRENTSINKKNKTGMTGVRYNKAQKNWRAEIRINGTKKHLGTFKSCMDAGKAYLKKIKEIESI